MHTKKKLKNSRGGGEYMVKTRLRNHLTDVTLAKLMRIAIEGPDHNSVNFEEVFKEKFIEFNLLLAAKLYFDLTFARGGGGGGGGKDFSQGKKTLLGGGNPRVPPLCMHP